MTATSSQVKAFLAAPLPSASLVFFRLGLSGLLLVMLMRFYFRGWLKAYYLEPTYHFSYLGFDWVQPWPGNGLYWHLLFLIGCTLLMGLGFCYRWACWGFVLGFGYLELLDKTPYLNHHYALWLLVLLMALMPLDAAGSLRQGGLRPLPRWCLWSLRLQVGLIYTFAGIAKLNSDWLVAAEPLRRWLPALSDTPWIGSLFLIPILPWLMSWAGMCFDLTIAAWLLWPRSRGWAFAAVVVFHGLTALLFPIGVFPWMMVFLALLFFEPTWPQDLGRLVSRRWQKKQLRSEPLTALPAYRLSWHLPVLGLFFLIQFCLPLRHWYYPGNVLWSEEGFRFSWYVMLIDKTGTVEFKVHDPDSGRFWIVNPNQELTAFQTRMLQTQPDMIHQYAQHLGQRWQAKGYADIAVYAEAYASLNGRPSQLLIDPQANLMAIPRSLKPQPFLRPLQP